MRSVRIKTDERKFLVDKILSEEAGDHRFANATLLSID